MDRPGLVNKKFKKKKKKNIIATKFLVLIKILHILHFFIFQGLINEKKYKNFLFHGLTWHSQ